MPLAVRSPLLKNPEIVFREEDNGAFLFNPENGELKCLNPMGIMIWDLCDGVNAIDNIETKIAKQYPDIDREKIHGDLLSFLKELFDIGYVGYQLPEAELP
ncbi:MAG: PqqD family peptide modification chaperone [Thermodesulfobacteriota bacterium]|nr:PqqD family peptide modification chaperone [Thermodesulfobacteriota bacterium]